MNEEKQILEQYYESMGNQQTGIPVLFRDRRETEGDVFAEIDAVAECNQMKVLGAMRKNRLSEACFAPTTGYGYNDLGRETLEKIYADVFGTEDALVRPQITCGYSCAGFGADESAASGR